MNALLITALVGMSAGIAPSAVVEQFPSPPPKLLTGNATPPGKPPHGAAALRRGWNYTYQLSATGVEPGRRRDSARVPNAPD